MATLFYRNSTTLSLLLFALLNAANGKLLKVVLAQSRPRGSERETYGMPSSHANSLFYFVGFLSTAGNCHYYKTSIDIYSLFDWHLMHPAYNHLDIRLWLLVVLGTSMYSVAVCYCRVYIDKVHTIPQITVGTLLGVTTGYMSYTFGLPFIERLLFLER